MHKRGNRWLMFLALIAAAPAARAQFAVIDVAAVTQLLTQVHTLEQQLVAARGHLAQAQAEFQSMTGRRGMERLLSGTERNYLPADWLQLERALQGTSSAYATLSADLRSLVGANALLSAQRAAALSAGGAQQVRSGRESAAILQVIARQALGTTSARFASLQQLIDAISRADDQKAILDLQARIAAEAGMLENEQTKLQVLYQSAQARQWVDEQRTRERVVAGHGEFRTRFQPIP